MNRSLQYYHFGLLRVLSRLYFNCRRRCLGEAGFGIPQALLAAALISISIAGIGSLTYFSAIGSKKSRSTSKAFALETQIITGFQNSVEMDPAKMYLTTGTIPSSFTFTLSNGINPVTEVGGTLFFSPDSDTPCAYDAEKCFIKVESALRCFSISGVSYPVCKAAYRISFDTQLFSLSPVGVLEPGPLSAVPDEQFTLPVAYDLFVQETQANCSDSSTLMVTGFDRDTGVLNCAHFPQKNCLDGEISTGLIYDSTTNSVELKCQPLNKFSCPNNYALLSFNPATFSPGSGFAAPTCVFIGRKSAPWPIAVSGNDSVAGTFCPDNYRTTVATESNPPNCRITPITTSAWCTNVVTGAVAEFFPTTNLIPQVSSGVNRTASCTVNYGPAPKNQSCPPGWTGAVGPSWYGKIVFNGGCELAQPETVLATQL